MASKKIRCHFYLLNKKMNTKKNIFILLLIIFFSSCMQKIDYLATDAEQIPVINCLFQEDSTFQVYVGLSKEIFSNNSIIIDDAYVYIIADNSDTIYLNKINEHVFESDCVAHCNVNYQLFVETLKYGTISASNSIPSYKPTIDTIIPDYYSVFNEDKNEFQSKYSIIFTDNPNETNYYEISGIELSYCYDSLYNVVIGGGFFHITGTLLNLENYGSKEIPYLPFSDISLDATNTLEKVSGPSLYAAGEFDFFGISGNSSITNLKSVSKDYYLYRKSLILNNIDELLINMDMESMSNMVFVEKTVQLHTNIENGFGIFAGYSLADQFIIDSIPFAIPIPSK